MELVDTHMKVPGEKIKCLLQPPRPTDVIREHRARMIVQRRTAENAASTLAPDAIAAQRAASWKAGNSPGLSAAWNCLNLTRDQALVRGREKWGGVCLGNVSKFLSSTSGQGQGGATGLVCHPPERQVLCGAEHGQERRHALPPAH